MKTTVVVNKQTHIFTHRGACAHTHTLSYIIYSMASKFSQSDNRMWKSHRKTKYTLQKYYKYFTNLQYLYITFNLLCTADEKIE